MKIYYYKNTIDDITIAFVILVRLDLIEKRKWRSHKKKLISLFLLGYFSLSKMFDV